MIWVKRLLIGLAALVVWIVLVSLFVSKERLCNLAMQEAARAQVTFCYEGRRSSPIGCDTTKMRVNYAHSPVAQIASLTVRPWRLEADGIKLQGIAASLMPANIRFVRFDPLSGKVRAEGDFGTLNGELSWPKRRLTLRLKASPLMRRDFAQSLRYFSVKNGEYIYVAAF